jgi:hypothetical protein
VDGEGGVVGEVLPCSRCAACHGWAQTGSP